MSAVYLARLLSCSVTDPQPYSFSSSTHADSSSLHSSGWEQLGGSHVPNTLLMCTSRAKLTLPMEISVITVSISLMYQLDLFIVLSNGPETNGCCCGGGGSSSVAYLNIRFHTRYAAVCSYFISLMSAVLDKFMWYQDLEFAFLEKKQLGREFKALHFYKIL